jgi:iron complex outermembrane receptor protein
MMTYLFRPTLIGAVSAALSGGAVAQQAPGTIRGIVLTPDSVPAPDADIAISELGRRTRSDSAGRFTLAGLRAGTYLLEIESARWGRAIEQVTVRAGGVTVITIKLLSALHLQDIVVSAGSVQRQSETYQAANVLSGRAVQEQAAPSLGETLQGQPGVTSTYNGPGASRPVIRGLTGDRVRVLEGGVGSGDASSTSPDHAVAVEPFTAERIEVIRGPATLLYGSSAIGGVVNVIDGRIPRAVPARPWAGELTATGGTASSERTGAVKLDGMAGPVAWHADALRRVTGDYRIPGHAAITPAPGDVPGTLPNSALETTRGAAGLSLVGERGYIGAAGSVLASAYGVPGGEGVTIDLDQRRLDVEGTLRLAGVLRDVKGRAGASDYEHREIEEGAVGTRFLNNSLEGRLEFGHDLGTDVHGALGFQAGRRDFEVIGDEAFVPPTRTDQLAAFLFEELDAGVVRLQVGGRFEAHRTRDQAGNIQINNEGLSWSAGLNWVPIPGLILVSSVARSVKVPSAEELFSNGPHLATSSFELGNPALTRERALNVEGGLRIERDPVALSANVYQTRFDDFIYQTFTGDVQDSLPVLLFTQGDARFVGVEADGTVELFHRGTRHLEILAQTDAVRATLEAGDVPLPRIPPWRIGGGFRYTEGAWHVTAQARRTGAQNRTAPAETATAGFTMVEASAGIRFFTGDVLHEITLRGSNLTDAEARSHTSFLKNDAPMPGRDLSVLYRMGF